MHLLISAVRRRCFSKLASSAGNPQKCPTSITCSKKLPGKHNVWLLLNSRTSTFRIDVSPLRERNLGKLEKGLTSVMFTTKRRLEGSLSGVTLLDTASTREKDWLWISAVNLSVKEKQCPVTLRTEQLPQHQTSPINASP